MQFTTRNPLSCRAVISMGDIVLKTLFPDQTAQCPALETCKSLQHTGDGFGDISLMEYQGHVKRPEGRFRMWEELERAEIYFIFRNSLTFHIGQHPLTRPSLFL